MYKVQGTQRAADGRDLPEGLRDDPGAKIFAPVVPEFFRFKLAEDLA
jgi:hypothetical protein